jgi:SulP family sulfate permease
MSTFSLAFHPRLFDATRDYSRQRLLQDFSAGLTVGMVALPLAMAFAIASGLPPSSGLFTAIIAGFIISALGGSRVQIGGPAGAFIVIVYGIIERHGVANLFLCTIFAGVLLLLMGMFKLGSLIRFIPVPIVIGFTNGIAVLIGLSQLKDFLGLDIAKMPGDFVAQVSILLRHAQSIDLSTLLVSGSALAVLLLWPKPPSGNPISAPDALAEATSASLTQKTPVQRLRLILARLPGPVIVLVLGTAVVYGLQIHVATIGSKFGGIPQGLPEFQLPSFEWYKVKQLFAPTITIALLGAIESLLCARVADNLIDDRHDPNQELMAQGIANIVVPFFAGMPATGTIARTMTNVRSGATSPVAGMAHAGALLLIVLLAAPLAQHIPLPILAAILLMVAWNMGEWREFVRLRQFSINYRIVMVGTFLLTVIFDLTVAVEVGMVLACAFFIYRVASLTRIEKLGARELKQDLPPGVAVYSLFGSLFFGAVDKVEELSDPNSVSPRVLILKVNQLINIDTTGLEALEGLRKFLQRRDSHLILCGLNHQPLSLIARSGFLEHIGPDHVVAELPQALKLASALVANQTSTLGTNLADKPAQTG